ncbi:hypothetical protein, partial [Escherichia coli]|uniref:hypothetical protein n=1 Tax=Escherichia coli TaxID=562 RepID=UPI001BC89C41
EWVHVQLHQQKGMISLSPPTICNSASLVEGGLSALSVPLCLKAHFCQAEIYNLRGHVSKNGKADSILTKRRGPA